MSSNWHAAEANKHLNIMGVSQNTFANPELRKIKVMFKLPIRFGLSLRFEPILRKVEITQ